MRITNITSLHLLTLNWIRGIQAFDSNGRINQWRVKLKQIS